MMDTRTFFLIALAMVGFLGYQAWQEDYAQPKPVEPVESSLIADPLADESVPAALPASAAVPVDGAPTDSVTGEPISAPQGDAREVTLQSDLLRLQLSEAGGSVRKAELLAYPVSLEDETPVMLLRDGGERLFQAHSGLIPAGGGAAPDHNARFQFDAAASQLQGDGEVRAVFTWQDESGLQVRKTYSIAPGSYEVKLDYAINNSGASERGLAPYYLMYRLPLPSPSGFISNPERYSFAGAAVYSQEEGFEKLPFDDYLEDPFKRSITGGWSAMLQHYFVAAWIPPAATPVVYETGVLGATSSQPRYLIRGVAQAVQVPAGGQTELSARLFVGPKLQDRLPEVAPGLELTVDYGFFTFFSKPLFWVLSLLHDLTSNWGLAIIGLTLLVKLAFFKLSEAQYRSMARMRKVQPRLEALKERFGDDRQKLAMAQMELFKKEKINPMGGCLPILVQIPVFIALYWVILESVELRQAPFFGWIQDLSVKDPYFVLPVLNALSMFATQRLSPTPGMDPIQRRVLQSLPIVFGVMFAFFPAGLVLYWTTNGVLSLAQQWFIMKRVDGGKK
ncbi:MAG: membrane protein insertase YidC [Xanthomonadales bacterium]|nr:membrane protein insertase YidC [Xanthomonadales bacterium]